MAEDMVTAPNGHFDPIASYARLSERVENQGKDIVDLRSNMNTGFSNIQSAINSLSNEFRGSSKTPWTVIWSAAAVCVTVIGGLTIMLLQPVNGSIAEVKSNIADLQKTAITRNEMDWRTQRSAEDRDHVNDALTALKTSMIGRPEWTERVKTVDGEIAALQNTIEKLRDEQRQDETRLK